MKNLLSALALAAVAVGAHAQVTYTGGEAPATLSAYDPDGPAGTLTPTPVSGVADATIDTTAGNLVATFLGFEANDLDSYTFALASGTLTNHDALGASISGLVGDGALNFAFADLFTGTTVGNGGNPGPYTSYSVLGSFMGGVFTPYTLGGAYDLILGFNDGLKVDADYDDMVIGLRVTPVPEPETFALMLAGLGAIGFIGRRRKKFSA